MKHVWNHYINDDDTANVIFPKLLPSPCVSFKIYQQPCQSMYNKDFVIKIFFLSKLV